MEMSSYMNTEKNDNELMREIYMAHAGPTGKQLNANRNFRSISHKNGNVHLPNRVVRSYFGTRISSAH